MKTLRYSHILAVAFLFFLDIFNNNLFAQNESCVEQYYIALAYYDQGRVDSTYQILLSCINEKKEIRSVSRKERRKIFKLAAESAYYLGRYDESELYAKEYLKISPQYIPKEEVLPEFRGNVENTNIYPKNTFGLKIIHSRSDSYLVNYLPLEASILSEGEIFRWNATTMVGFQFKHFVRPRIAIGTDIIYGKLIQYTVYGEPARGSIDYHLDISALEFPLFCSYNLIDRRRSVLFLEMGFSLNWTMNSLNTNGSKYSTGHTSIDNFETYYYCEYNGPIAFFFENSLRYNYLAGAGASFKLGIVNLGLNVRYLPNHINPNRIKDDFNKLYYLYNSYDDLVEEFEYPPNEIWGFNFKYFWQISLQISINLNYQTY